MDCRTEFRRDYRKQNLLRLTKDKELLNVMVADIVKVKDVEW